MKSNLNFFGIALLLICLGCATSKGGAGVSNDRNDITVDNLPNYLNTISRLSVSGGQVHNTSVSTFHQENRPLFVVDGVQVGRDLSRVLSILPENKPFKVKFVKMSRATLLYGGDGRQGVITIDTGSN